MKSKLIIVALLLFLDLNSNVYAQNTNLAWAKQFGGINNTDVGIGRAIAVDANGNTYSTGGFHGTVDFDPGPGTYNLSAGGDIFICKLDPLGNFLWARQFSGPASVYSIAVDGIGNVYTTGQVGGTVDFDPGPGTYNLSAAGNYDIFVSKLDPSGNFVWAKQMGGPSPNGYEIGYSITVDLNSNVYTTGRFHGTSDFDPGVNIFNLTSTGNTDNIFISKLDYSGNFVWAKQFNGTNLGVGESITVDINENVFTTGIFVGTFDFDPGAGIFNLTSVAGGDTYISKLDAFGNFVWAKQMGGQSFSDGILGNSNAIDANGNIYITGFFEGTIDFDPGPGTYNMTSAGSPEIFVSKLDGFGNFVWAKQMGGGIEAEGYSIALDASSNVYTTGRFKGTCDFDPGAGIFNFTSAGGFDFFLSKLDASGNFIWAKQMGGSGDDGGGNSIVVDSHGNIYSTGSFVGTADFDPGPGIYNLTTPGDNNVYVVKLWQDIPTNTIYPKIFLSTSSITAGQNITITGTNYTNNGKVKLNINGPGNFSLNNTFIATNNGSFTYSFVTNTSMTVGIYNVLAKDSITGKSSPVKSFQLINNTPSINYLKITSPIINTSSKVNKSVKIAWSDIPSHISTLIPNKSQVNAQYKIEYNKDNSGWQLIEIKSYSALYKQQSNFQYNYTPSQTGSYQFRVTDMLDAGNSDISATVTVNNDISGVVMNYDWDYSGNRPTDKPMGLAADGTARIYVKIVKKAGNSKTISNVNITVSDPVYPAITEPRLIGKLMVATDISAYSIQANAATLTTVNSTTSGPGNVFWFWYVGPDDFVRNDNDTLLSSRELNLVATVTYSDNTTDGVADKVEVVRPPLMFVHGIGGNETTWDDFYYSMNGTNRYFTRESDSRWKFRRALNTYPGGSYIQNAQLLLTLTNSGFKLNADVTESYNSNSFQYFLQQMRTKGYSCNRVDYVAHSMGGDIARTAINLYSTETPFNFNAAEYKPSVSLPRKFKNYNNGFINKLITLNTPHNGSPWADLTIEKLSHFSPIQGLLQAGNDYSSNGFLIRSLFNTIGSTNKLDFNNPTDALKNLRFGVNGVKFQQSVVKNHLISGDLLIGGEDCLDAYNIIRHDQDLGLIYKLFAAIGGTNCIAIDGIFVPYGVNDFFENSDFVVPLSSELPGKNISGSGNDYSIYYGVNPNHLSIHNSNKNPSVGQKVFSLLNAPISSVSFANTIVANTSSGSIIYRPTTVNNFSEWIDTSKIVITNPTRGINYSVDSTINISVRLKDTLNFKYLNVLFQSDIYSSSSKATNQNFSIQVNPVFVDSQMIVASAVYDSLGNDVFFTDTLSLNILKDIVVNGFYITPKIKYLNNGQTYIPTYNLIHNSYITNVSILDTALHITVADANVVTYSNIQKNFIGKDTGTTYAVISYKQFKDTLYLIISEPSEQNIIRACPQGNISFFAGLSDTTKNYQWQVDTASGFQNISASAIYSGVDSSILTLNNPPTNWYNYKYRCIISDSIGQFFSDVFTLRFALTWSGAADNAWENPANWSCNAVPDANTDVYINAGMPRYAEINSNATCRRLNLQPGTSITVKTGNNLDITGKDQ